MLSVKFDVNYYDLENKISIFQTMCHTIISPLKIKTLRGILHKFYKVVAVPSLWIWNVGFQHSQATEMIFLWTVAGSQLINQEKNVVQNWTEYIYNLCSKVKESRQKLTTNQ